MPIKFGLRGIQRFRRAGAYLSLATCTRSSAFNAFYSHAARSRALCSSAPAISNGGYTLANADADIAAHKLVVFTKSYCSFCRDLTERLTDAGVPHYEVVLDSVDPGNTVRDALKLKTGHAYVPFVFLDGQKYDGDVLVEALKVPSGSPPGTRPPAEATLRRAGITAPGFFRP